jgi:hypothetical protein
MPNVYLRKLAPSIEKLFYYRHQVFIRSVDNSYAHNGSDNEAKLMGRMEVHYAVRLKRKFHSLSRSANSDTFGRKTSKILSRSQRNHEGG